MPTESDLLNLAQEWQALADDTVRSRFYDEQVFPAVCAVVIPREQGNHPDPYTHLILPVGLQPEPLILSILILRPQHVYFLYTTDSEKYLDRIFRDSGLTLSQVKSDLIDETNVPDIYRKVKETYERWGRPKRVAVDISGGKKSMTGGCALAGAMIGAHLFYMDSRFETRLRKPVPGTEHLAVLNNPYDVFGDLEFERAQALFAKLDFVSASALLSDLQRKTSTPEQYEARALLCQAYAAWDDWRIPEAAGYLGRTLDTIRRYQRLTSDTALVGQLPFLETQYQILLRLQKALELNLVDAHQEAQLLTDPALYQPLVGTLRAGAVRQAKRGKLDVATLLWYRIIELLSQRRLSQYGLRTSAPDYSRASTSQEALLARYQQAYAENAGGKKNDTLQLPTALPEDLALLDGYLMLKALGDPFVQNLHIGKIRSSIQVRNRGIFAHGFKPLSEKDYTDFSNLAEQLLEAFKRAETTHADDWQNCAFIETL